MHSPMRVGIAERRISSTFLFYTLLDKNYTEYSWSGKNGARATASSSTDVEGHGPPARATVVAAALNYISLTYCTKRDSTQSQMAQRYIGCASVNIVHRHKAANSRLRAGPCELHLFCASDADHSGTTSCQARHTKQVSGLHRPFSLSSLPMSQRPRSHLSKKKKLDPKKWPRYFSCSCFPQLPVLSS